LKKKFQFIGIHSSICLFVALFFVLFLVKSIGNGFHQSIIRRENEKSMVECLPNSATTTTTTIWLSSPPQKETQKQKKKQKTLHRENSIYQAAVVVAVHASPIVCMQGT